MAEKVGVTLTDAQWTALNDAYRDAEIDPKDVKIADLA